MALIANLGSDLDERFALHQPLLELGIDSWWWHPGFGLEPGSEFSQHLRIQVICFSALEQRLGKIVCLSRVDYTHGKACLRKGGCKGNPVGAGCFQDDQNSLWGDVVSAELVLEEGITLCSLLDGGWPGGSPSGCHPRDGERCGRYINSNKELVGTGG